MTDPPGHRTDRTDRTDHRTDHRHGHRQKRPRRANLYLDGYRMAYQDVGPVRGRAVLLIHGMVSDSTTWQRSIELLADRGLRVIAPDLLGHGDSDKPSTGYGIPSFADHLHLLLDHLKVRTATVVGHSYGAAVAMAMAYNHPQKVDRLVLVAAGGLGREIHPVFRAATLPGARAVLGLVVNERTATVYRRRRLHRTLRLSPDVVTNLGRAGRGLSTKDGRRAFFETLHSAIRPSGQRGSMLELNYLHPEMPVLLVWSENDAIVPVEHARFTHARMVNSKLVVFPGSTHQPHHRNAERFAAEVAEFIATFPAARSRNPPTTAL
jgi:pimeloyl-ACP methyl ester carboxylesterase